MSCSRTQDIDGGEARTRGRPRSRVKHSTTEPLPINVRDANLCYMKSDFVRSILSM